MSRNLAAIVVVVVSCIPVLKRAGKTVVEGDLG
jgi:hypothetical protein